MQRAWLIFTVVSLFFFFVTAATFTSLGVVLFTMAAELHWSKSAAGSTFAVLGLTCGLSSPLPALLMKWMGTRRTIVLGGATLALAFALAATAQGLWEFIAATGLMGLGFTLAACIPAVYLLATWFPRHAGRVIGLYFMAGGLGGVFGPLVVNAIVEARGWRANWWVMTGIAAGLGVLSALFVKDIAPVVAAEDVAAASAVPATGMAGAWTVVKALRTRQFVTIALTMLIIQTVVTTIHGLLVTHLAGLGLSTAFGAVVMSLLGLTDALAKGAAGTLAERMGARRLFVAGLVLLCVSVALLAFATTHAIACVFALVFGVGWGVSWLAANLLLLDYFGSQIVAPMMSAATFVTTAGIVGPIAAGMVADATGTFVPFFYVSAALMVVAAIVCARMRLPAATRREYLEPLPLPTGYP